MSGKAEPDSIIRFGPFEAHLKLQEVRKHGRRLRMSGQSFHILKVLLERPGDLVTRDELKQVLWPADTFVDFEHGIGAAVNKLRDALGDNAENPRYVETLPRRGYRFVGSIEAQPPDPSVQSLTIPKKGQATRAAYMLGLAGILATI